MTVLHNHFFLEDKRKQTSKDKQQKLGRVRKSKAKTSSTIKCQMRKDNCSLERAEECVRKAGHWYWVSPNDEHLPLSCVRAHDQCKEEKAVAKKKKASHRRNAKKREPRNK